tara:strand:- start:91417 stop:92517 length:1101 start_codon:yes stop_codon:yes gene_type:complete
MNFEFSEEQRFIGDQARTFLSRECTPAVVRRILDGQDSFDARLWQQIISLGWTGITIPENFGGTGLGYLELCLVAQELGRAVAPVPFSSSAYLGTEAILRFGSSAQQHDYLPRLASGESIGTLAIAEGPGHQQFGARVSGDRLSGEKYPVADGDVAHFAVVSATNEQGETALYLADLTGSGVQRKPLHTMDPSRSQAQLTFDACPVEPLGGGDNGQQQLARLLDRAAVLIAFEQVGGAQAALDMGVAYTRERYAFGRPVASFQAIKHKFADMYVSLELARANAYYGAWALATDAPDLPLAAATARVSATDAYYQISKENIQVHGGMGFTWEFDCHLHYRRAQFLSGVLNTQTYWKKAVAERLLNAA